MIQSATAVTITADQEQKYYDDLYRELRPYFRGIEANPMNLLAMAKRLFRGRFDRRWVRGVMRVLEKTDAALLTAFPFLRRYCGEVLVVAERRSSAEAG